MNRWRSTEIDALHRMYLESLRRLLASAAG